MSNMEILNINIIQNVRKFPELYQRNCKFADRGKAWNFLAKSLKLDEKFLKSRWHILRELYAKHLQYEMEGQRRNYFRYTKEMDFMRQHIKIRVPANSRLHGNIPVNWVKPEFVITAADLEMQIEHHKDDEELLFIEIEEETGYSNKETNVNKTEVGESCLEIEESCQEIEDNCNEVEDNRDDVENDSEEIENNCNETENNCQEMTDNCNKIEYNPEIHDSCKEVKTNFKAVEDKCSEEKKVKEIENQTIAPEEVVHFEQKQEEVPAKMQPNSPKSSAAESEMDKGGTTLENNIKVMVEQKEPEKKAVTAKTNVKQETLSQPVEMQIEQVTTPSVERITEIETVAVQKPESPISNIRSEDAIFGELIVAMLKSMDPVKKKSIKKEIMNLLLS